MVATVEVELKYEVPEGVAMPPLDAAGAVRAEPPVALAAVYLDTADRVLLAARIAVRRRTGGHDAGWHVKLPAARGRVELQEPIDPDRPDVLPAAFERALRSRVRGAPLVPIARIATTRRAAVVSGRDGGRVEVVDDAVRATDVGAGVLRVWREWEAERLGASPADDALLAAVDGVLLAAGATRSGSPAKLAQALGGALPAAPAPRARTAGAVLVQRLVPLREDLHRAVLGLVLEGDPDGTAVHGLRKTLRRMRSLLALAAVAGPGGDAVRQGLGTLAAALGEARDPLVAAGIAEALLGDLPADSPGLADARRELVDRPRAGVAGATAEAIERLIDPQALATYAALDRLLTDGPEGPDARRKPQRLVALARRERLRTRRRAARAGGDLDALHAARKAAKRSRMVVEELVGAGLIAGKSGLARSAGGAQRLQEVLGDHRDLALLLGALPAASARISAEGGNAFATGLLAADAERRLRRLERNARKSLRG